MTNETSRPPIKEWFKISKKNLTRLFTYFILLLILGIFFTVITILHESLLENFTVSVISIIGGIGTSLVGSTIFYLRKLYKASIGNKMTLPSNEEDKIRELGIQIYYYLRPIFAVCFSLLAHIILKASVAIVSISEVTLDSGMIYLSMVMSFFIGFSAGDMLSKIESYSKDVVNKTLNRF